MTTGQIRTELANRMLVSHLFSKDICAV